MNSIAPRQVPLSDYAWIIAVVAHLLLMGALVLLAIKGSSLCWFAAAVLLPSVPGLLRRRRYTFQWTCMLVAIYCALWLAEGWYAPDTKGTAFGVAALAAIEFMAAGLYIRLLNRERPAPAAGSRAA
ncbi:MAG: DUF2069 domain-containing protein [Pseudomonadota bacterium]|nr:DUF2069 domain-containing protein [Pseudomonadota bacterium]